MTPTFRLDCQGCKRFLNMLDRPVICTGTQRVVPSAPDGLIYAKCLRCGTVSRYEVVPNMTPDELLTLARTTNTHIADVAA